MQQAPYFRYATRGVILDTNVFLVWLIGQTDPVLIQQFKRTSTYSPEDYALLAKLIIQSRGLCVTPHIITEACNHLDTLNKRLNFQIFTRLEAILSIIKERRSESRFLSAVPGFKYLGLADIAIVEASTRGYLVITDEGECFQRIQAGGGLGINLNHLRFQNEN